MSAGSPDDAADAAWAASGTMHAAAAMLRSRVIRQAADAYDRAARAPYDRIPPPSPAGSSLRDAARLLSAIAVATSDPALRPAVLVLRLAALAEAVAGLRESQQRAAQADGALRAARCLHAAAGAAAASPAASPAYRAGRRGWPAPGSRSVPARRGGRRGPLRPRAGRPAGFPSCTRAWALERHGRNQESREKPHGTE